jgi:cell fate regulator YaaT (PSP1 superfamily)
MVEIVGVGFMKTGKTYYFDPVGKSFELGDMVIVETARGMELGHILIANKEIDESELVAELKPVERKATDADLKKYHENLAKREDALRVCAEKIEKHGLELAGVLPQDELVYEADWKGEPSAKVPETSEIKKALAEVLKTLGI